MTLSQVISLFGGIGLFLYGMTLMSSGIRKACGSNLQKILEKATNNRAKGVLVGTGVTVLVQSSSATDVMVIGFVNSGFMTLSQAITVIMGANIGTTVTAQVTAFNLGMYAPMILFIGAIMALFIKKNIVKHIGTFILGFGMLFQGISLMKTSIAPLAKLPAFIELIQNLNNPFLLVLIGVLLTAVLQSSSSATVIFQAFAVEGLISFPEACYLVIGSAIGSVAPNFLASLTTNRNGKRTAMLNLLFNLFRAVLVLTVVLIFPGTLRLIQSLSPEDVARQVANAHTFFALFAVLVLLPFSELLVKLTQKLLPFKEDEIRHMNEYRLHYLVNPASVPATVALHQARMEISRMGHIALDNLKLSMECFFHRDPAKVRQVEENEEVVDFLDKSIVEKLAELRTGDMTKKEMDQVYHMTLTSSDLERISDLSENFAEYALRLNRENIVMSDAALQELTEMSMLTIEALEKAMHIFDTGDFSGLEEVDDLEEQVDRKQEELINAHVRRLMEGNCNPLGGVIFTDMTTELERCSDHAVNIAYSLSGKDEKKDASSILAGLASLDNV